MAITGWSRRRKGKDVLEGNLCPRQHHFANPVRPGSRTLDRELRPQARSKHPSSGKKAQEEYVDDFADAVITFLNFHEQHAGLSRRLADAVTRHATPVGSGTVARTQRIPVEQRAEAAVIAWMRHQTTAYDSMTIQRVRGKRREVRRMLAARSKALLSHYRQGFPASDDCPLQVALNEATHEGS